MGIAGILNLIPLALFVVGSLAKHVPKHEELKSSALEEEKHDNFLFWGKKWVVLVAGSRAWSSYRHQADICHAYQIIRGNGIPKENIITMMVDDIAYNAENPTPGKIINRPNGENVYEGVVIDYKGKNVTSKNFLNIIKGNKTAMQNIGSGKVVQGGQSDKIFINIVGYGSFGLFMFPDDYLYADQLNDAFVYMHEKSKYNKMLLYFEASKAGSMFDGLIGEDTQILAVTASGPRENSYACYCGYQSGRYRTCLGDLFSVTWMEELDATMCNSSMTKKTVFKDFSMVRTNVTESNVMVYGDFKTGHEKLSEFIGYRECKDTSSTNPTSKMINQKVPTSSRDVHEDILQRELSDEELPSVKSHEYPQELSQNNKMRFIIDSVLRNIYTMTVNNRPDVKAKIGDFDKPKHLDLKLDMFPCYRSILNKITENCFSLPQNPYALDRLTIFANLCIADNQINQSVNEVVNKACSDVPKHINNVF